MNAWKKIKLEDITSKIGSGATPRGGKNSYKNEGISLIRSMNIFDARFEYKDLAYIDKSQAKKLDNVEVKKDDVLINITGASVCRCTSVPDNILPARVNQHVSILRADGKNLNPFFLKYYLIHPEIKKYLFAQAATGATREALTKNDLENLEIKIPDYLYQQRIAGSIKAYDDLIENNQKRIRILEEIAQRLYTEWFVKFKFSGHEKVKMVDSGTEFGMIPEGWEIKKLQEVCVKITDGAHQSPKSVISGKPMASVKDMHDWGINYETCRQISQENFSKLIKSNCKPEIGDILIAKDGSYLKHSFVVSEETDYVVLSSIAILRPNGKYLSNQLSLFLKLPHVKKMMKRCVSGSALPRIILREFRNFNILVPSMRLQDKWSEFCDPMLDECRILVKQNSNLIHIRDLLIENLVTGKRLLKN